MSKGDSAEASKPLRAIDYIREHSIEQKLEEFIGQIVHERPNDPYGVLANKFASQSQPPTVTQLKGHEILLSTGRPTLQVEVWANMLGRNVMVAVSNAPIGTSVFNQEQKPYLDTNTTRFLGLGSRNACTLVELISSALQGKNLMTIDQFDMIIKKVLDGKSGIVNVLSAASFALARASAIVREQPLFLYLYESIYPQQSTDHFSIPTPAITVIQGGMHATSPLLFESVFIIPKSSLSYIEQLRICSEIAYRVQDKLYGDKEVFAVGKAGGYVSNSSVISSTVALIEKCITETGLTPGTDIQIGIDCAASYLYDTERQLYQVEKGVYKNTQQLVQYYLDLLAQHPSITILNDGNSDLDHGGWDNLQQGIQKSAIVSGGDIYGSQAMQSRRGLKKKWTDAILLQPGQAGTLSEAAETAKLFKQKGKQVIVGRRSGETCDTTIVDFAVAIQAEYFMGGGIIGSEGSAKYNHMLRIYEYLRDRSMIQ